MRKSGTLPLRNFKTAQTVYDLEKSNTLISNLVPNMQNLEPSNMANEVLPNTSNLEPPRRPDEILTILTSTNVEIPMTLGNLSSGSDVPVANNVNQIIEESRQSGNVTHEILGNTSGDNSNTVLNPNENLLSVSTSNQLAADSFASNFVPSKPTATHLLAPAVRNDAYLERASTIASSSHQLIVNTGRVNGHQLSTPSTSSSNNQQRNLVAPLVQSNSHQFTLEINLTIDHSSELSEDSFDYVLVKIKETAIAAFRNLKVLDSTLIKRNHRLEVLELDTNTEFNNIFPDSSDRIIELCGDDLNLQMETARDYKLIAKEASDNLKRNYLKRINNSIGMLRIKINLLEEEFKRNVSSLMNLVYALATDEEKIVMKSKVNQLVTDYFLSPRNNYINWVKANKANSALLEHDLSDTESQSYEREVDNDTDDFVYDDFDCRLRMNNPTRVIPISPTPIDID